VASRDLEDPNFIETVILLLDYSEKGTMGLILNRTTDVRLSELLPEVEALQSRTETVFAGGPVGRDALMLLVRSREPLEEAKFVFRDVYVTASADLLEELAAEDGNPRYRAFVGYAGWGPGQLDIEIERGSWHIVPGQAATVFDPSPAQIWKQLIRSLSMQFASLRAPAS
jgi:putative transcriptional regulator